MATWHQIKGGNLAALYAPHATLWNVVEDKPGEFASGCLFRRRRDADKRARRLGAIVIPPLRYKRKA